MTSSEESLSLKSKSGFDYESPDSSTFDILSCTYVSAVSYEHLLCPICKLPFHKPYSTICGHTFCKDCLTESFKSVLGQKCPLDRVSLRVSKSDFRVQSNNNNNGDSDSDSEMEYDVYPAPIILSNMTDDLKVKCFNHQRGCEWVGPRWSLRVHVESECVYTRVKCNCGEYCEKRFLNNDTEEESSCPHELIDCPKCEERITNLNLEDHYQHHCMNNFVNCVGCGLKYLQMDMEVHLKTCQLLFMSCAGEKFGCTWKGQRDLFEKVHVHECVFLKISGYLEATESKMDYLKQENENLKLQMSTMLDAVVQGKIQNLGYGLDRMESSTKEKDNSQSHEVEMTQAFDEASGFERVRTPKFKLSMQKVKVILGELDTNRRITDSLVTENIQLREDVSNQRAMINALRQQMQYMLLERRRMRESGTNISGLVAKDNDINTKGKLFNKL